MNLAILASVVDVVFHSPKSTSANVATFLSLQL